MFSLEERKKASLDLVNAIMQMNLKAVKTTLAIGALPHLWIDDLQTTPMIIAIRRESVPMVWTLFSEQQGALIYAQNIRALGDALLEIKNVEIARILILQGLTIHPDVQSLALAQWMLSVPNLCQKMPTDTQLLLVQALIDKKERTLLSVFTNQYLYMPAEFAAFVYASERLAMESMLCEKYSGSNPFLLPINPENYMQMATILLSSRGEKSPIQVPSAIF